MKENEDRRTGQGTEVEKGGKGSGQKSETKKKTDTGRNSR